MKEFFGRLGKFFLGSGGTAEPENSRTTGPVEPENSQTTSPVEPKKVERGENSTRGEEPKTTETWDSRQRCLVVETKQVLELGSIGEVRIKLTGGGDVDIIRTDEVQQPELTITGKVFADSEPEARVFYTKNGSGVNVRVVDSESLLVTGEGSSGVVSGESEDISIGGAPRKGVVMVGVSVGRNNKVNINGLRIGSSQPTPRRETRIVLKVPVSENVNEGKKPEPAYFIETGSGDITVENATGRYTISTVSGDIIIRACNMVKLRAKSKSGDVKVIDGIFQGENTIETETGDILFKFGRNQGEIEVQTIQTGLGRGAIQKTILSKGVKNPNGQTAELTLFTQTGEIKVN